MPIVYHGSSVLFDKFDLSHATEGDGKIKFGFGVYLTQRYKTAAHYAFNKHRPEMNSYYVYTVQMPEMNESNTLYFDPDKPVAKEVISKVEEGLGEKLPDYATGLVKELRRYLANKLSGRVLTPKKMIASDMKDISGEKAASAFLHKIGYVGYRWPVTWAKPDGEMNYALFDENRAKILQVDSVSLDENKQLIPDSQFLLKKFES